MVEYVIQSFTDEGEVVCLRVTGDEREAIYSGLYASTEELEEIIDRAILIAEDDYGAGDHGLPWIAPLEDEWWLLRTGRLAEPPVRVCHASTNEGET